LPLPTGKAISSKDLAYIFDIDDAEANPITREAVKDAMRLYAVDLGITVGANGNGYFLIKTMDELQSYLKTLEGRIQGIRERKSLVKAAWCKDHPFQKTLLEDLDTPTA